MPQPVLVHAADAYSPPHGMCRVPGPNLHLLLGFRVLFFLWSKGGNRKGTAHTWTCAFVFPPRDSCERNLTAGGWAGSVRSRPGPGQCQPFLTVPLLQIGPDPRPAAGSQADELQHHGRTLFYWPHWQRFDRQHNPLHPQDGDSRVQWPDHRSQPIGTAPCLRGLPGPSVP